MIQAWGHKFSILPPPWKGLDQAERPEVLDAKDCLVQVPRSAFSSLRLTFATEQMKMKGTSVTSLSDVENSLDSQAHLKEEKGSLQLLTSTLNRGQS